jgi:hypothetical protein
LEAATAMYEVASAIYEVASTMFGSSPNDKEVAPTMLGGGLSDVVSFVRDLINCSIDLKLLKIGRIKKE